MWRLRKQVPFVPENPEQEGGITSTQTLPPNTTERKVNTERFALCGAYLPNPVSVLQESSCCAVAKYREHAIYHYHFLLAQRYNLGPAMLETADIVTVETKYFVVPWIGLPR
jgi:hypothetical protein